MNPNPNPESFMCSIVPRRFACPVAILIPLLVSLGACVSATKEAPATSAAAEGNGASEQQAAEHRPESAAPDALQRALAPKGNAAAAEPTEELPGPPDGEWLTDDEGNEYYVLAVSKETKHHKTEDGKVYIAGVPLDLEAENEDDLFVKIYRTDNAPEPTVVRREPTEEEIAAAAAEYAIEVPTVDRLELHSIDAGLPRRGQWRNSFVLADLDRDDSVEIVQGPPRKAGDQPVAFRWDGEGAWGRYRGALQVPPGILDYGDVAVDDFDADGRMDLAFAAHLRGVRVFRRTEGDRFELWSEGLDFSVPGQGGDASGFTSRRLASLDWNGDGLPDLVALDEGPHMADPRNADPEKRRLGLNMVMFGPVVYLNEGNGSWTKIGADEGSFKENFGDDLVVADFDGDGRPDFATSSNRMGRTDLVHLNQGDGTWRGVDLALRPRGYVRAVAAADFDGDGTVDLALSYVNYDYGWRAGIDVYLNRDEDTWERRGVYVRDGRVAFTALEAGDVDGDGHPDLVALDMDGGGTILLGVGDGSFELEEEPALDQPVGKCRAYQVRLADLDGDGRDEIVGAYADEGNAMFEPDRCPSKGGMAAWSPTEK